MHTCKWYVPSHVGFHAAVHFRENPALEICAQPIRKGGQVYNLSHSMDVLCRVPVDLPSMRASEPCCSVWVHGLDKPTRHGAIARSLRIGRWRGKPPKAQSSSCIRRRTFTLNIHTLNTRPDLRIQLLQHHCRPLEHLFYDPVESFAW